ncbi:MAG: ABC transporter permease [Pseudomonadota bacterium]
MANIVQQIGAVSAMSLRSIPSRLGSSLVIVIGIAGVVGVMVALLSMAAGFEATLASTGRAERVIMLRGGATDELGSVIYKAQGDAVRDVAGIKQTADGRPLMLLEVYLLTEIVKIGGEGSNVVVRGTDPDVLQVRDEARIVQGRMFRPGTREVIVGRGAQSEFEGLALGKSVDVRDGGWTIVGVFETGGDTHESELWVDRATLQSASRRLAYTTVTAVLEDASPAGFTAFKDRLTTDPRLNLQVQREPDYYKSRSVGLSQFINGLGYTVAVIMAIGALFGALNTMYAAISTRTVEIGTLRAIGFGGAPVVISILIEALLLALAGSLIGAALAYFFFNGYTVSTLNIQTFSQTAFAFRVTPAVLMQGVIWAVAIGFLGGLFPALRAARLPVTEALRAQ